MNARALVKGLVMLAALALLGFLFSHFQLDEMLSKHWIDSEVRDRGWAGMAVYLAMGMLVTSLGFPRQVVAFLGGYAFGFIEGTLLATVATALGCILDFHFARWLGRGFVQRRFPDRIRTLDDFLRLHPFSMTLLIRLLPVGHNTTTNLLAGVSGVPALAFLAGSALGYLPQNLVFALAGSGVAVDPTWRLSLAALLFVVSSLLGAWLYRRHRSELAGVAGDNE